MRTVVSRGRVSSRGNSYQGGGVGIGTSERRVKDPVGDGDREGKMEPPEILGRSKRIGVVTTVYEAGYASRQRSVVECGVTELDQFPKN